jgi:hypothetical protein
MDELRLKVDWPQDVVASQWMQIAKRDLFSFVPLYSPCTTQLFGRNHIDFHPITHNQNAPNKRE